jgi:hypothetical protein
MFLGEVDQLEPHGERARDRFGPVEVVFAHQIENALGARLGFLITQVDHGLAKGFDVGDESLTLGLGDHGRE